MYPRARTSGAIGDRAARPLLTGASTLRAADSWPRHAPTRSLSCRSGIVSSARKNAPKTIWTPRPSRVTRSAVSYARPRAPKPALPHSSAIAARPGDRQRGRALRRRGVRARASGRRPSRSSSGSRSPIRTRAYVRANTPSWIDLRADQRQGDEPEHRVDLPGPAEHVDRARREQEHPREPQRGARHCAGQRGRASSGYRGA